MPVALRVKWILIGRFSTDQRQGYEKSVARVENESRRFSFRSRNLSQFKADFKLFKALSAMLPKKKQKTINTDKTQPTLFTLLYKDRASEPVSETQDSQAQDNSQSDSEAAEKSCSTDSGQSG